MARLPYLNQSSLKPEDIDLLTRPINLFRVLAASPAGLRKFQAMGDWIRWESPLDGRLRELAILYVGYLSRCEYEYGHHIEIGRDFGVTDDDVRAMAAHAEGRPTGLGQIEEAVLQAARELTVEGWLDDRTWSALRGHFDDATLVDLVLVIGYYNAVVRILGALEIDVEKEYSRVLSDFPLG